MQKSTLPLASDTFQETRPNDLGTNCMDCSRYKTLGEVCVIEHGKKFLWEFCRDFQPEVKLPEYDELMRTVKKEMAVEREKFRQKKKRERILLRKELEQSRKSRKKESSAALKDKMARNAEARPSRKIQLRISQIKKAPKTETKGQKSSGMHISSSGTMAINRSAPSKAHERDGISSHSKRSQKKGRVQAESKANGQPQSESLEITASPHKSVSKGAATKKSAIAEQTAPQNQVTRPS